MNKIIAIVGMCGSGKSIASDTLIEKGYQKVYFGSVTMEILKEKGLAVTPENEKVERESLRAKYGMGAYAIILLPKIKEYFQNGNVVLDGLYSWDELKILNENFEKIYTIAIINDKEVRYSRLAERVVRPLTNSEACNRDIAEIENLAKGGPIVYADYFVLNNGSLEEYKSKLNEVINKIESE